jgi:hypothetical protein
MERLECAIGSLFPAQRADPRQRHVVAPHAQLITDGLATPHRLKEVLDDSAKDDPTWREA